MSTDVIAEVSNIIEMSNPAAVSRMDELVTLKRAAVEKTLSSLQLLSSLFYFTITNPCKGKNDGKMGTI